MMDGVIGVTRTTDSILRTLPDSALSAGLGFARVLCLPESISLEQMQNCLHRVVQENESLHVRFYREKQRWYQEILEVPDAKSYFPTVPKSTVNNQKSILHFSLEVSAWLEQCQQELFDLEHGKILISSSFHDSLDQNWCYLSVHPAVVDSYTIDSLWGRIAAILRHFSTGKKADFLPRISLCQLLEAQRKTAALRFAHTEFWNANPLSDMRNEQNTERIFGESNARQKIKTNRVERKTLPHLAITKQVRLSPEIKSLLLESATAYGGTWEQAQIASIASYLGRKLEQERINLGYTFSNLLLFEEAAAWSDAAAQIICCSETTLPISIPIQEKGLEQMKQVKVQIDRIEDYSLITSQEVREIAQDQGRKAYEAVVDVRLQTPEILVAEQPIELYSLSNGCIQDALICVQGSETPDTPSTYQIFANPSKYREEELESFFQDLMTWQYHWALAVLNERAAQKQ